MPLNYSKWDNLELSDDSDIEVHPNIDKKSFIRWKQRDIHEKRDQRKAEKDAIRAEIDTNNALAPRLDDLIQQTKKEGSTFYSREVAKLSAGRQERGNKDGPNGPTTDDMILSLLLQVQQQDNVKGKSGDDLDKVLVSELQGHRQKLDARQTQIKFELEQMENEDSKKITSDGIKEGWNSGYVAKAEPEPQPKATADRGKKKAETVIETLNSPSSASGSAAASAATKAPEAGDEDDDDDEEDSIPEADDIMRQFANLPSCVPSSFPLSASTIPANFDPAKQLNIAAFETALQFLSKHKILLSPANNTTDSLLLEAFNAQIASKASLARRCVEKALMIQYCNKLGPDGVNLFFRRMVGSKDGRASVVYLNDVLATYSRIRDRSKALAEQQSSGAGEEQIQLVAEDENTVIGFDVPDGPPPEVIELEGEAKEKLNPEDVKKWLQKRWEIFEAFPEEFKEALKSKDLTQVNKVLGNMKVEQAEEVVGLLDQAGILSFSSSGVRDETGR